jgi:hypothetical protein
MLNRGGTVRLEIHSNFEMVDFVQVISESRRSARGAGRRHVHWIGVAVRDRSSTRSSTAIARDSRKIGDRRFTFAPTADPRELVVRVLDQGEGFEPRRSPIRSPPRTF